MLMNLLWDLKMDIKLSKQGITESGSHDELMNKKGHYYDLYMAQFKTADEIIEICS